MENQKIKKRNRISIHEDCLAIIFIILAIVAVFGLSEYRSAKKFHTRIQKQLDEQKYFLKRLDTKLSERN